jgi:hypothetical protein
MANTLSKLTTAGNLYTTGTLDEATFNPNQNVYSKNTLTASNAFDNTNYWSRFGATPLPNSATAPDGTNTAYFLRESAILTNGHYVQQVPTWQNGYRYTYSIYAKAGTRNFLFLLIGSNAIPGQQNATYNLNTGVVNGIFNTAQGTTASMQDVGNGWWRCSLTTPAATSTGTSAIWVSVANGTSTVNYLGDGVSGIYIWGSQIEQGTVATIYVPTALNSLTPSSNTLSKLDSVGNYYTKGTIDEVTFNPTSTYRKNLLFNSNFVGGISGSGSSGATVPTNYITGFNGNVLYAPAKSGIGLSCRFYGANARPYFSQYNFSPIYPNFTYTYSVTIEDVSVPVPPASTFIFVGGVVDRTYAYYINGVSVPSFTPMPVGTTGKLQCVFSYRYQTEIAPTVALWRIGFGTSNFETGDITLANPQIEIGNTLTTSQSIVSYQPTTPTGTLASSNNLSKLDTVGNNYLLGSYDEVTFNPNSGYIQNLAAYSQNGSQWTRTFGGLKIISTNELAPDGTYTAVRVRPTTTFSNIQTQNACWLPNISLIGSIWVRVDAGTRILSFGLNGGGLTTNFTATSNWQRFSTISYLNRVTYNDYFNIYDPNVSGFVDYIIWGWQVERGTSTTTYVATGAGGVPLGQ